MDSLQRQSFWSRRLDRQHPLGFGLTLGVLVAVVALGCFTILAVAVQSQSELVRLDQAWATGLHEQAKSSPWTIHLFLAITHAGHWLTLTILTSLVAAILFWRRHYLLAIVWVAGVAGGGMVDGLLKLAFQRQRPQFPDPIVTESTTSFPSGHSMGSLVAYGLLAYLCVRLFPPGPRRRMLVAALAVCIFAIGFSRMYLGAHFFSDVLGGFAAGICWLALVLTPMEVLRRHEARRPPPRQDIPS
jgi:undecaprenyl-diphosphatase